MRARLLASLLLAVAACAVLASAAGAASWSAPQEISAIGVDVGSSDVVVDGAGVPTAVWVTGTGASLIAVQASRYLNDRWSAPVTLNPNSPGSAGYPEAVVDAQGAVTVVWGDFNGVVRARRFAGGLWESSAIVATGQSKWAAPQVAVDASGIVTAAWVRTANGKSEVLASRYSSGAWGAPATLSSGAADVGALDVDANPNGVVTAVWIRNVNPTGTAHLARYSRPGKWYAEEPLGSDVRPSGGIDVAADGATGAAVTWVASTAGGRVVRVRRLEPLGWGQAVDVSGVGLVEAPSIAMGRSGAPVIGWPETTGATMTANAAHVANGVWGSPALLGGPVASVASVVVGADPAGEAIAVWSETSAGGVELRSARLAGGAWGSPSGIATGISALGRLATAVDPSGVATAVWTGWNGANMLLYGSRQAPDAPASGGTDPTPAAPVVSTRAIRKRTKLGGTVRRPTLAVACTTTNGVALRACTVEVVVRRKLLRAGRAGARTVVVGTATRVVPGGAASVALKVRIEDRSARSALTRSGALKATIRLVATGMAGATGAADAPTTLRPRAR